MRADTGRPALQIAVGASHQLLRARRLSLVAQLSLPEPELAGALREARLQRRNGLVTPRRARRQDDSPARSRAQAPPRREPEGHRLSAALRWPTAAPYWRKDRPGRSEATKCPSKYARLAQVRPYDHQPVRGEDERRHFTPQLLRGPKFRSVDLRLLARADLEGHLKIKRYAGAVAAQMDPGGIVTEANQLRATRVRARPLPPSAATRAGSSCPRRSDRSRAPPRLQLEIEPGIGAKIAERERADYQPANPPRHRLRCRSGSVGGRHPLK